MTNQLVTNQLMTTPFAIRGQDLYDRCQTLATCSDEAEFLGRYYLTPGHRAAITLVDGWMREAGMETHVDAVGNLIGRYAGTIPDAKAVLIGSHIDTVRDGGRYDGMLGIIAGIAVVDALHKANEHLPFALEVIAFGDEEGVRFNSTLIGSRAVAGTLDAATLQAEDRRGITLAQALSDFGLNPDGIQTAAHSPTSVLAYLEVHIEQGPVLEQENLPVGVVTSIFGATRRSYSLIGRAGHAGTVPMTLRRDALAGAAEAILAIEAAAAAHPGVVATVGRIEAAPGAVNVIPGKAAFSLDIRAGDDALKRRALADIDTRLDAIAEKRALVLSWQTLHEGTASPMDEGLSAVFAEATAKAGIPVRHLPSGAGHDAMAMVSLCPSAMLFVRCKGGVSHNPAESILPEDAGIAARILLDTLLLLAQKD